ncbi:MAG TPA: helix-turn-helix domain-containing protein [Dinghuibacter sp.]|jgi:DNA-binding response OmpR family regulator|uniref:response regulator transcription factor n=1 Tax=Dinghuibacter sp. TaxID=2024697 RepID=UPI002B6FF365|nr:helix-turn-helix domain-containing protein [Dinghuibacter sp.]HTJ10593.1 helix-turn-helix domain-containing protein [Dinghuibacter sp.]
MGDKEKETRIIIIEDDFVLGEQLEIFFGNAYTVSLVTSVREGILLLEQEIPDLVITDVMLPGGQSGFDIIRFLRRHAQYLHVPILTISGLQDEDKALDALRFGANDFITKPVSLQTLRFKVENLLALRNHISIRRANKLVFDKKAPDVAQGNFDLKFRARFEQVVEELAYNSSVKVSDIAAVLNCSVSTLERWCDKTYSMTPMKYILHLRLLKASVLLEQNYGRVKDIAYETGFSSLSYFSKCYKAKFGKPPRATGAGHRSTF